MSLGKIVAIEGGGWFDLSKSKEIEFRRGFTGPPDRMYLTHLGNLVLAVADRGNYTYIRPSLEQVAEWYSSSGYDRLPFDISEIAGSEV